MSRGAAAAGSLLVALAGCLEAPPTGPDGPPAACGTAGALKDEFDGDALDGALWDGTGGVSVSGGAARIISTPGEFNTLQSAADYRVSGSQLVAELDVSALGDALLSMELDSPGDFQVGISLESGELGLRVVDEAGERMVDSAPLEQDHLWWRLREEAGQFFWATSPDGTEASWTERGPFAASSGEIARVDFDLVPNSQGSTLIVHAVNPGTSVPYCAAASFTDAFGTPSDRWQEDEQGDCDVSLAGQLVLGYSTQAFCALTARERFDLRDSSFAVELADVGDCKPEPIMVVTLVDGDELAIHCQDDAGVRKLIAANYTGAGEVSAINYDPALHRFVRLRHDSAAGNVEFEALGDAAGEWASFGSLLVAPGALAHTGLRFFLGGEPTTSGVFEAVSFDSLNLAPEGG